MNMKTSLREQVLTYALTKYHTSPEYLWKKFPDYAVLRHENNRKWYGIIMNIPRSKLGQNGDAPVDVLNIKCDPLMSGSLMMIEGVLPAYHMKKGYWLSILLDGTIDMEQISTLLDMSYHITLDKKYRQGRISTWLIPANPKYYDIEKLISENKDNTFIWKQSSNIKAGDTVYLYVGAPVSAIRCKCEVVEADIPYQYNDSNIHMNKVMRLKTVQTYDKQPISFELLKSHGVNAVRGPRSIPESLIEAIDKIYSK
ncbi:MAG: MmcQ/YjbR family DNA-binding protein [Clostridium sp.]|nr:MmcQ/YjbR family DNA-binding protein [Clostridium sp.]